MKVFVSGHLDLTENEFIKFYKEKIDLAISIDSEFIIGDARGADTLAQKYLHSKNYKKVTIYHMFSTPRNNVGMFKTMGGFISDNDRDIAMTLNSDIDIAYIKKGGENSGTAKNIYRRKAQQDVVLKV